MITCQVNKTSIQAEFKGSRNQKNVIFFFFCTENIMYTIVLSIDIYNQQTEKQQNICDLKRIHRK